MAKRVLSVGQCMADHGSLSYTIGEHFDAEVIACHSAAEAQDRLTGESFDLILVNRVFDRDGDSGINFIRDLKGDRYSLQTPVMLVSNHAEAQAEAVQAGALPGFGKASLGTPSMLACLQRVLQ